ncbi:MAG: hypothetical protein JRJ84_19370, partial [Deltaproteobacteria bacterium]|nr:hypothetical protein [Deltaproteobacteria bacterium]
RKFMRYASAGALVTVGVLGGTFGLLFTGLGIAAFIDGLSYGDGYGALGIGLGILGMGIGIPITIVSIALIAAGVRLAKGRKRVVSPTAWVAPDGGGLGLTGRW